MDATQTYQFVENVSLFRGKHAMKMGVDIGRHISERQHDQLALRSDHLYQ